MQHKSYYIGIDMGTQGARCGIVDDNGEVVAAAEEKYDIYFPKPGYATQKPDDWKRCLYTAISRCSAMVGRDVLLNVKGISVCATSSTVVAVDEEGNALCDAILWMDTRAKLETEKINSQEPSVLKHCGNEVSVEWLVPKTLWIKDNTPEIYKKAYAVVEQLDYVNYMLTGRWAASICQATCKGNYVENEGGFNSEYFKSIGLNDYKEKLNTTVLKLGEKIGQLKSELADKYKLPHGIPVYQGGIDAHIAMLGLGVCSPGDMGIIMGTSFVHLVLSDKAVYSNGIWGPYKDAVIPGLYCLEGGQVSAGSITKWFLNEFGVIGENPYMTMANEAEKSPVGSKGVITLDFFQGNRTPYKDPNAKGVFYGLTLNHTRADIYRSILEGIAFGTKNIIDSMASKLVDINNIIVCGGVTKNPLWMQIISDVTGMKITMTKNSADGGILGCAIVSAVGSGRYIDFKQAVESMVIKKDCIYPNEELHSAYDENYKKYLNLYKALKNTMAE